MYSFTAFIRKRELAPPSRVPEIMAFNRSSVGVFVSFESPRKEMS